VNVGRDEARWWIDEQIRRWIAEGVSPVDVSTGFSWWQVRELLSAWLLMHQSRFADERLTIRRHRRNAAE
jgi:hypothetical protein